jgi:hypothetical protein
MEGGDKRWEQHRPQDHHEYHGWKEHHITYFLPRTDRGICVSKGHATLRGARPVRGDSSGGNHLTRSVLFDEGRPDDRRLGAALPHNHCLICRCTASSVPRTCCVTTRLVENLLATHRPEMTSTRSKQPSRAIAWPVACDMIMAFSFVVTSASHAITAGQ